jgi:membrane peptidoglycan carboxypeptidase
MSRWIPRAVLTAEDGDFFYYQGVNFYTLPRALERNLLAGEIQFGASTLSMQLVKMLFLDAGRIISRKLQEVFLVHLMENVVPVAKERILELYINLAEFGPGVFGIADAAWYYFRASPADLTAGQAVWLASILPSPKRYHQYYEAGGISPGWFERMKGYFAIMVERGRMTPEEYADAAVAPPRFVYSTVEDAE